MVPRRGRLEFWRGEGRAVISYDVETAVFGEAYAEYGVPDSDGSPYIAIIVSLTGHALTALADALNW